MAALKYDEKFPAMVEELAARGEPDARIASRLDVSLSTFYVYKQQFPEFAEALTVGRKLCYSRVRTKLLQVAQGHCSVTTEIYKNGELYKTTRRWLSPNLKAIIYFQKNMRIGKVTIKEEVPAEDDSRMSKSELSPLRPSSPFSPFSPLPTVEDVSKISKSGRETESAPVESGSRMSNLAIRPCCPSSLLAPESISAQPGSRMSNLKDSPLNQG